MTKEKEPFFEEILRDAIDEMNINDRLTDFFIREKGIGLVFGSQTAKRIMKVNCADCPV